MVAFVLSACAGEHKTPTETTPCLLSDDEKVEIAKAVSTAVEADPTFEKVREFLALYGNALTNRPPDGVAWGFRYAYGEWVSEPSVTQFNQRLVFDDTWGLHGFGDNGLGETDIRLVNDGTTLFSYRTNGDLASDYTRNFSASRWSSAFNEYDGGVCMSAGTHTAVTPGTSLSREWCGSGDQTTTFQVRTGEITLKVEITSVWKGTEVLTTAVVEFQGRTRHVTQTAACLPFTNEVLALQPSYAALFDLDQMTNALTFNGPY